MIINKLEKLLNREFGEDISLEWSRSEFADISINPGEIRKVGDDVSASARKVKNIVEKEYPEHFSDIEFKAGYLNFNLSKDYILGEIKKLNIDFGDYLENGEFSDQTVVFDYSSPNIAKPFSIGHLRSTIIGQANLNIHKSLGYNTVGVNHIGDWGTQFGKLIVAIKKWGDLGKIEENPIEELRALYVKFHDEADKNPSLNDEARLWFNKLEQGDEEARDLWRKCVEWSLEEFDQIYSLLNIKIDEVKGESFYEDKLDDVINDLEEAGLLEESQGAKVVELDEMPPALIQKSDGSTLYMTRDLAALKYRIKTYKPTKVIYHVGNEQKLHFMQLKEVARKLGWLKDTQIVFAGHGLLRLPEGKMSSRKGRVVLLRDLIERAKEKALNIIDEKGSEASDKTVLAHKLGVSAIKYADLKQNRRSDVVFSFDKAISLKGDSATYIQYTYARIQSIKRQASDVFKDLDPDIPQDESFLNLFRKILKIKSVLENAANNSTPNLVCEYLYDLTNEFNSLYESKRIVVKSKSETEGNVYALLVLDKILRELFKIIGLSTIDSI